MSTVNILDIPEKLTLQIKLENDLVVWIFTHPKASLAIAKYTLYIKYKNKAIP